MPRKRPSENAPPSACKPSRQSCSDHLIHRAHGFLKSFPKHLASDPRGGSGTIISTPTEEWQGRRSEVNKNVNKALQGHFQKTDTKLGELETQVSMVKKVQEDMAAVQKEMKQAHENNGRRLEEVTLALNDLRAVLKNPSDDAVQAMTSGLAEIKLLMQQSQHLPEPPKETCCAMTSELAEMKLLLQQSQHLTEHPKAEKNAEEVPALLCSKGSGRSGRRSQGRLKTLQASGDERGQASHCMSANLMSLCCKRWSSKLGMITMPNLHMLAVVSSILKAFLKLMGSASAALQEHLRKPNSLGDQACHQRDGILQS